MSHLACRIADLGEIIDSPELVGRHRTSCLRCQAEAVRTNRLLRELRTMRNQLQPAPDDLVERVAMRLTSVTADAGRPLPTVSVVHRAFAAAGAIAAAVAGAAVVAVWRRSHAPA